MKNSTDHSHDVKNVLQIQCDKISTQTPDLFLAFN